MAKASKQKRASTPAASVLERDYVLAGGKVVVFQAALIALVTLWVFSPALGGDWLWDDTMYLSHNPLLTQPERLWKAWFQPGSFVEYYPLQQTLQYVQWRLWGNNTFPYHLTNVLLHIANALLLWRLLARLGVRLAWIGGLIFAVHPVNVEAVAWISEFKSDLALLPALLAMSAWIDYEDRGQRRDYRISLALFLASMLCKITMAMFPFVILLVAWWRRGRIGGKDVRAALPFFLISLVLGLVTIESSILYLHHLRNVFAAVPIGGPLARLALAGTTTAFYFAEIFLPWQLLPIYPQWQVDPPGLIDVLPWLAFGGAIVWLWKRRATWGRHVLLGLGFFLINLAPFCGLRAISYMSFTWVMDHFLYLPGIGIIGLIAAAIGELDARFAPRSQTVSTALITALVAALAFRAHWYAAAFTNDKTLWTYTVERNPGSWMAQDSLGKTVLAEGSPDQAASFFTTAVALQPALAGLHGDLGDALVQAGRPKAGVAELRRALELDPNDASVNNNLGIVLARAGKSDEAIAHFITSVRSKPDDPQAYSNLGNTYFGLGRFDLAVDWYQQALKLKPDYVEAWYNLGSVQLKRGKFADAAAGFEQALQFDPNYIEAHNNLGIALTQLGRVPEAILQFQMALQLDPDNRIARENLAKLQPPTPDGSK